MKDSKGALVVNEKFLLNISTFTGLRQIAEEKIDIYQNAAQKVLVISCLQVNGGIVS